ncbi:MAG: hypothetical protein ACX93N_10320 [Pseudohaliea sp.]
MSDQIESGGSPNSRISIKLGALELEFEGSESFLENHLSNLIELIASIPPPEATGEDEEGELLEELPDDDAKKLHMSTSTIAQRLGAKKGPDLILAACAHLLFVKGHDSFTRKNILAEMQTESPREFRRLFGLSQATIADSVSC